MYTTKQEIFDVAYKGLRDQGWRQSKNAEGRCRYRNGKGDKCAIGHLIPDEDYAPVLEHFLGNDDAIMDAAHIHPDFRGEVDGFLYNLQSQHDDPDAGTAQVEIPKNMAKFAKRHNLTIPE